MLYFKKAGFTLIELTIVIIIIGILAVIAMPIYNRTAERARDSEAITNLNLIKSAELIYYGENNSFWPASGSGTVSDINSHLRLNLTEYSFNYSITALTTPNFYNAIAQRSAPSYSRNLFVTNAINVACAGNCL